MSPTSADGPPAWLTPSALIKRERNRTFSSACAAPLGACCDDSAETSPSSCGGGICRNTALNSSSAVAVAGRSIRMSARVVGARSVRAWANRRTSSAFLSAGACVPMAWSTSCTARPSSAGSTARPPLALANWVLNAWVSSGATEARPTPGSPLPSMKWTMSASLTVSPGTSISSRTTCSPSPMAT